MRRRKFLQNSMLSLGGIAAGKVLHANEVCTITPQQTSGPFYPGENSFQHTGDLTWTTNPNQRAIGQVIYIKGKVLDERCLPVANANVELWQASHLGGYNHEADPSGAPVDPNFKYWAEVFTDDQGEFLFKTIKPKAYPASDDWIRPAHLHFRVAKRAYQELVTQMYFKNDPYNADDFILQGLSQAERDSVVVDFLPVEEESEYEKGASLGEFTITLNSVRRR